MTLTTTPVSIQDDKMNCFERFLVLPYGRTGQHLEVHKAGKQLFTKRDKQRPANCTYLRCFANFGS